jgi:hypothetical protein
MGDPIAAPESCRTPRRQISSSEIVFYGIVLSHTDVYDVG